MPPMNADYKKNTYEISFKEIYFHLKILKKFWFKEILSIVFIYVILEKHEKL